MTGKVHHACEASRIPQELDSLDCFRTSAVFSAWLACIRTVAVIPAWLACDRTVAVIPAWLARTSSAAALTASAELAGT